MTRPMYWSPDASTQCSRKAGQMPMHKRGLVRIYTPRFQWSKKSKKSKNEMLGGIG